MGERRRLAAFAGAVPLATQREIVGVASESGVEKAFARLQYLWLRVTLLYFTLLYTALLCFTLLYSALSRHLSTS